MEEKMEMKEIQCSYCGSLNTYFCGNILKFQCCRTCGERFRIE